MYEKNPLLSLMHIGVNVWSLSRQSPSVLHYYFRLKLLFSLPSLLHGEMPGISMMSKCGLRTENRFQKSETDVLVPKIWLLHAYYCRRDIWRSDQLNPHSCSKSPVPIFNDAMKRGLGESVFHYRFLAFAGDSTAYEKLRQPHNGSTELLKLVFIKVWIL